MNRESERKRLVELISECCAKNLNMVQLLEFEKLLIADHLLDDGWMRPPVKVNTFAYFFIRNKVKEGYVERIFVDKSGTKICVCYDGIYFKTFKPCDIGKTVFTSREEAEAKLKGGESDA